MIAASAPAPTAALARAAGFARTAAVPWIAILLLVAAVLPLAWPAVPPLVDVPAHIGRYRIALDYAASPSFRHWFEVRHVLVGNLGVDLLASVLAPALGLEPAVKLIAIAIPVLATAGLLLLAREAHGRVGPLTALPAALVYNYPFNYGFLNYSLAMSLALLALGGWAMLGRTGRTGLRALCFVPVGCTVWLVHASGWGLLGLMIFGWELASARRGGAGWWVSLRRSAVRCLPLAAPLVPMLAWAVHVPAGHYGTPEHPWARKFTVFFMALRDGSQPFDAASVFVLIVIAALPIVRPELGLEPRLATVGAVLCAAYAAMPPNIIGSAHADMRISPYALMLLLLALRERGRTRWTRWLARLAPIFLTVQTLYHTANFARVAAAQEHQLEALEHIPLGTTVFALVDVGPGDIDGLRFNHLQRMATARRQAFTNGGWTYPATQTVLTRPTMTSGYEDDGSQLLEPVESREKPGRKLDAALQMLPRDRFHYLWLINLTPGERPSRTWLHRVWQNDRGALYAIDPPAPR